MAQKQQRRLTNEVPYKEKEGKNRRFMAWLFTILLHMIVVILLAALKLSKDVEKEKKKEEIGFGMEVVKGRDNTGSNSAKIPIDAVNPSITTPSESSKNITTSDKSDIQANAGKQDVKKKKKNTRKKKKSTDNNNAKNTGGNKGESTTGQKGDDKNKDGNKGSPNGTVNNNALYNGSGGVGNDPNLKLSGWTWLRHPTVKDQSDARGKIVFKIYVNDDGIIQRLQKISSTVGASIVAKYAAQIKSTARFKLLDPNKEPQPITVGTLVISIKRQ
ncbi:hypothetical protein BKI52_01605 [marine bacterium AO1-C]|nr:hypothetical protein BKI52_01605 [marine bacterium AO1-C]